MWWNRRGIVVAAAATSEPFRRLNRRLMLSAGVLSAVACPLLMLMVIGNTEGALYPLFLTALYG